MEIEKSRKRALRRQHIARLKKARQNYWGYPRITGRWDDLPGARQPMDARQLGKVVQYPQACSCAGCCNVRRAPYMNDGTGLTYQEKCHWQRYREGLEEIKNIEDEKESS